MYADFAAVLVFIALGVIFVCGNLLLGGLLRPRRAERDKLTVYECGEPTIGSAWIRFNSRFYTIALVYLLFDVEVVVLVPAMLVLRDLKAAGGGGAALLALLGFLGLLVLGLVYEWYWGNLDWIGRQEETQVSREARDNPAPPADPGRAAASETRTETRLAPAGAVR